MKSKSIQQLFHLLRAFRAHLLIGSFLALLPAYFSFWTPYLLGRLVDGALIPKDLEYGKWICLILAFAILCHSVFTFAVNYLLIRLGLRVLVDYRLSLIQRLFGFRISFWDRINSGKLSTRLSSDVNSLYEFFSGAMVSLIGNLAVLAGVFTFLFWVEWRLSLVVTFFLASLIFLTVFFNERIRRKFGFSRRALTQVNSITGEALMGVRDLKGLGASNYFENEFQLWASKQVDRHLSAVKEYANYQPLMALSMTLLTAFLLVIGGYLVLQKQMSLGELVIFLGYTQFFAGPLQEFSEKITVFQQALASVDRLVEISNGEEEVSAGSRRLQEIQSIEFKDVDFQYPGASEYALHQVNFLVKGGEKIGLVGETGAGKSTICSLIKRFYDPGAGKILINGEEIRHYDLKEWRARLAWVSQDVQLFSTSLRENVRFFDEGISDQEVWSALETVQLAAWVRQLPQGLDTALSQKAMQLSSGQRQLLSIARAICVKPKILILDEATAYIDSTTEYEFQKALEALWASRDFKDVTTFIVAHRWSTLRKCDRILWMKDGRLHKLTKFDELQTEAKALAVGGDLGSLAG
jgi:ABC-type multidrug transport system fused ATPase/permease subunit